jgi:zinc transporter ZupT
MTMQKSNILGIFVGLFMGLVTVLGMSLFTFINLKFNSVYYAQHISHKEGTEPDVIMLMENMGWAYTPEIDGISYDDDGMYAITRNKGTERSILGLSGDTLYFSSASGDGYLLNRNFSLQDAFDEHYHKIKYNQRKVQKEIRETVQPVIDAQSKPLINLQWLFNLIYQSRFN